MAWMGGGIGEPQKYVAVTSLRRAPLLIEAAWDRWQPDPAHQVIYRIAGIVVIFVLCRWSPRRRLDSVL
jgi:hypothetical protein